MRLGLLASGASWHVDDLLRASSDCGIKVELKDFVELQSSVPGESEFQPDAFLVRSMPAAGLERVIFRMDALHVAEARGIPVFNSPRALECCIDKFLTTHRLVAANIPVPPTWCGQRADDALTAFDRLGGDVLVKPLFGSEGRGISRLTDADSCQRVCHAIEAAGGVIYMQRFVSNRGWDLRAFVLGDRVIAAMKRHGNDNWLTNISQGGRAEAVSLDCITEDLALAAARATGSEIVGVDMLHGPDGWVVLEVNGVPGWRALSQACNIDVAAAVINYVVQQVRR
jgi:ribosomal protein S6--L-glutamate ligase